MWPHANIGIATGPSGLVALDVDPDKGGGESLVSLVAQHGQLPDTIAAITGGGGQHYYFRAGDAPVGSSASKLGPGLDIRAVGGYVVAPPSLHRSGRRYQWEVSGHPDDVDLAPPPDWLYARCAAPSTRREPCDSGDERQVSEGSRNDSLTRTGGKLRRIGMAEDVILAALLAENAARCNPPLPEQEVRDVARSIARYPAGHELNLVTKQGRREEGINSAPVLLVRSLADIQPRAISWLWPRWLARGKVAVLGGHPGDGKSTLTAAFAATLSRGGTWPDDSAAPQGKTLFLVAEDAPDDVLRPRLDRHRADPTQISVIDAVAEGGRERLFNMAQHLPLMEELIAREGIALVVIDPLTSFMPNSDRNGEGDVRDLLTPLGKMAERTGAAILCIMHVGKPNGTSRRPVQQLLGATAFGAVARTVMMIAPVSDEQTETRRVLGMVKSNLAMRPLGLEWSMDGEGLPIAWHGVSSKNIDELLGGGVRVRPRDEAEVFVREALAPGPMLKTELSERARVAGISGKTLERGIKAVGPYLWKQGGMKHGPWVQSLEPYRAP
jgi:energy-coupling factor transporter ATP-binding protein EcfA2